MSLQKSRNPRICIQLKGNPRSAIHKVHHTGMPDNRRMPFKKLRDIKSYKSGHCVFICTVVNLKYATPSAIKKKHKICAFYYVFGNFDAGYRSQPILIHLAVLVSNLFPCTLSPCDLVTILFLGLYPSHIRRQIFNYSTIHPDGGTYCLSTRGTSHDCRPFINHCQP